MFAFLNIERASAMEWYKRILVLGLPEPRDLNINPKNTIGTVISLNGHRKYYCLFHAKHPEGAFGVSTFLTESDLLEQQWWCRSLILKVARDVPRFARLSFEERNVK